MESVYHRPTMTTPPVAQFSSERAFAEAEGGVRAGAGDEPVDVLVLTALQDELDAVLALGGGLGGAGGRQRLPATTCGASIARRASARW